MNDNTVDGPSPSVNLLFYIIFSLTPTANRAIIFTWIGERFTK